MENKQMKYLKNAILDKYELICMIRDNNFLTFNEYLNQILRLIRTKYKVTINNWTYNIRKDEWYLNKLHDLLNNHQITQNMIFEIIKEINNKECDYIIHNIKNKKKLLK